MSLVKYNLNGHTVEYDDTEFEVHYSLNNDYLHYIGNGINVTNLKGNTSCYCMFQNYKGTSLDLTNFDTHNITDMSYIFAYCSNLSYLNLSNFDTHNVRNMSFMFYECMNLKHLNLSNFNTHKVTDMVAMFYECINLKALDISKFDTSNVMYMERMFRKCENLKELDISSFCINDTKMLDDIFGDCKSLDTLKVSSDCLQFFLAHKKFLLGNCGNVNIISISKLDKAVNDLFY